MTTGERNLCGSGAAISLERANLARYISRNATCQSQNVFGSYFLTVCLARFEFCMHDKFTRKINLGARDCVFVNYSLSESDCLI